MESLAYLHLALVYEDPEAFERVLNWNFSSVFSNRHKFSSRFALWLLSLVTALSLMSIANTAFARIFESSLLQFGNQGIDIERLQVYLNQLGYSVPITRIFDSATESAVIRFQQDRGISVNGVVDRETEAEIERLAFSRNQLPPPTFEQEIDSSVNLRSNQNYSYSRIDQSSNAQAIRYLQQALINAGYNLPRYGADGQWGSETAAALNAFQQYYRIPEYGFAGLQTLNQLQSRTTRTIQQNSLTSTRRTGISAYGRITQSSGTQAIRALQQALINAGYNLSRYGADGQWGSETETALNTFRRNYGIPEYEYGVAGLQTLNQLDQIFGVPSVGLTPSYPQNPNPPREARSAYVVVVPVQNNNTFYLAQQESSRACLIQGRQGNFVQADYFTERNEAERLTYQLRAKGLRNARVVFMKPYVYTNCYTTLPSYPDLGY